MRRLLLGALLFVAAGCTWPPVPIPGPTPTPSPDGGATCATACEHLGSLGCKAATPTAKGATCTEVCQNTESSGLVAWGVDCVVQASTCEAADACGGAR
jgi:hypothetical protein